ncbi:ARM REPEAT PROTEIN INTERACTING WITH abf2 [Castilleja foliolosa]|uniref:ARM REPEAT PROTEIN INTERACTING WITH abf2 n=1 Tax=Castilleja foliolosa TaxID=1961234 RepID=A0ABD3CZI4_9LAMI
MGSNNLNFKNFVTDMPPEPGRPAGNFPLARQPSVYSLTFDEFQNTVGGIGKDFGSMNMDELLKNIWSAEENQNIGSTSGFNNNNNGGGQDLQRQVSLTLPRTLSQKTVEEVWRDMAKEYSLNDPACGATGGFGVVQQQQQQQRQPTLGEVTLEEFLVRAGVVKEETHLAQRAKNVDLFVNGPGFGYPGRVVENSNLPLNVNGAQSAVLAYPNNNNNNNQLINPGGIRGGIIGISDTVMNDAMVQNAMVGLGGNGMSDPRVSVTAGSPVVSSDGLTRSNGDTSSVSPVPFVFNNGGGLRGRKSAGLEKVVERRHKRMIKNRESAARSRARKQAYTMELEAEVAQLKEENELLQKKQAEMLEMQKNQVLEMMKQQNGNKRRCLRRTQTGPW